MSDADTTTQSSDTKPQQLATSGEGLPQKLTDGVEAGMKTTHNGTKHQHLDATADVKDPKVYLTGEGLRNALPNLAVGTLLLYHGVLHEVIDAGTQGHRVAAVRLDQPKVVHEWKEGFTTFRVDDGYLSWEGEIGAGRVTVPQIVVSELARLAGELETCRELSRDRQQRALDAEDEVGRLAEQVAINIEGMSRRDVENLKLAERVEELEMQNADQFHQIGIGTKSRQYLETDNARLREAAATSIRKCEQYWNEHNIPDAEVHAALELIHSELRQALRREGE